MTIIAIEVLRLLRLLRLLRRDSAGGMLITQIKQSLGLSPRNRQVSDTVQALKRAHWVDADYKNRLRYTGAADSETLYDLVMTVEGGIRLDGLIGLPHWSRWAQGSMQRAIRTEERLKEELSTMLRMMSLRDAVGKGTPGPRLSPRKEEFSGVLKTTSISEVTAK